MNQDEEILEICNTLLDNNKALQEEINVLKEKLREKNLKLIIFPEAVIKRHVLFMAQWCVVYDERKTYYLLDSYKLFLSDDNVKAFLLEKYGEENLKIYKKEIEKAYYLLGFINAYLDFKDRTPNHQDNKNDPLFQNYKTALKNLRLIKKWTYLLWYDIVNNSNLRNVAPQKHDLANYERQFNRFANPRTPVPVDPRRTFEGRQRMM